MRMRSQRVTAGKCAPMRGGKCQRLRRVGHLCLLLTPSSACIAPQVDSFNMLCVTDEPARSGNSFGMQVGGQPRQCPAFQRPQTCMHWSTKAPVSQFVRQSHAEGICFGAGVGSCIRSHNTHPQTCHRLCRTGKTFTASCRHSWWSTYCQVRRVNVPLEAQP